MANYPQELAQDAVCQSHTGHMTGLWFLCVCVCVYVYIYIYIIFVYENNLQVTMATGVPQANNRWLVTVMKCKNYNCKSC